MKLTVGQGKPIRAAASFVRMNVFVIERHIKLIDEFDDKDSDNMTYAVMFDGETPVATARFESPDERTLKIGRVATLKDYRGQGLGAQVLTALEEVAKSRGKTTSLIHSEVTAQGFYESLGYQASSDVFVEDGVDCIIVEKSF